MITSNVAANALTQGRAKLAEARKLVAEHKSAAAIKAYQAALDSFAKGVGELESFAASEFDVREPTIAT